MTYQEDGFGEGEEASNRPLAELAYERIKRAILRCDLEPGSQVTEEQLAERFGISRSVVRPALKRLYQQQLVKTVSRNRYIIPPITLKDAHELFELRLMIEPPAAKRAAGRVEARELERLEQLCEAQYEPGDRESADAFLQANAEFHVGVARASGNDLLAEVVATLLDREQRLNHLAHMLGDRNQQAFHEHRELVEALIAGDGDRAEAAMAEGIRSARAFVIDALMSSPAIQQMNVTIPRAANGSKVAR
jgi:DNA-binding GntR family transcriptional regulator